MDSHVFFTVWILITIGLCLCQNYQIEGPLNGKLGKNVTFRLINPPSAAPESFTWNIGSMVIGTAIAGTVFIPPSYRDRASVDGKTATLELRNLTFNDNGEYILTIVSDGVASTPATTLSVFENAPVSISLQHYVRIPDSLIPSCLKAGKSSANITCEATGNVTIRKWIKDGDPLSPNNRITLSEDNRTVSISPVQTGDYGNYQCQVSNPFSSAENHKLLPVKCLCPEDIFGITIGVILIVAALGVAGLYIYKKTRERNNASGVGGQT